MVMKLSAAQCRMARAGLGIGVRELATAAKVSTNTITRLEAGEELKERTVDAVCAALEALGAEFTNAGVEINPDKVKSRD
jgi:transcriptional regulator with XRE-family HTH domain